MRAYAHVDADGVARFYLPATGNRVDQELVREGYREHPAGWYRARCTFEAHGPYDGTWSAELGRQVDPAKEAARLRKLSDAARDKRARTDKPGIGSAQWSYQHMENMANAAIETQRVISDYFAELLSRAT